MTHDIQMNLIILKLLLQKPKFWLPFYFLSALETVFDEIIITFSFVGIGLPLDIAKMRHMAAQIFSNNGPSLV